MDFTFGDDNVDDILRDNPVDDRPRSNIYGSVEAPMEGVYDWDKFAEPDLDTTAYLEMTKYLSGLPVRLLKTIGDAVSMSLASTTWWNKICFMCGVTDHPYQESLSKFTINRIATAASALFKKVIFVEERVCNDQSAIEAVLGAQGNAVAKQQEDGSYVYDFNVAKSIVVAVPTREMLMNAVVAGAVTFGKEKIVNDDHREVKVVQKKKVFSYVPNATDHAAAPSLHPIYNKKVVKLWDVYYNLIAADDTLSLEGADMSKWFLINRPTLAAVKFPTPELKPLGNWIVKDYLDSNYTAALFSRVSWLGAYKMKHHRLLASVLNCIAPSQSTIGGKMDRRVGAWTPQMMAKQFCWMNSGTLDMSPDAQLRGHVIDGPASLESIFAKSTVLVEPDTTVLKVRKPQHVVIAGMTAAHYIAMENFGQWVLNYPVCEIYVSLGPVPMVWAKVKLVSDNMSTNSDAAAFIIKNIYKICMRLSMRNMELYLRGLPPVWLYRIKGLVQERELKLGFLPLGIQMLNIRWKAAETKARESVGSEFTW